MKARHRRSGKALLILGCDSRRALTIDQEGNLVGYWLRELKATALEAQLRWMMDTKGVEMMLETATSLQGDDEYGVDIAK